MALSVNAVQDHLSLPWFVVVSANTNEQKKKQEQIISNRKYKGTRCQQIKTNK